MQCTKVTMRAQVSSQKGVPCVPLVTQGKWTASSPQRALPWAAKGTHALQIHMILLSNNLFPCAWFVLLSAASSYFRHLLIWLNTGPHFLSLRVIPQTEPITTSAQCVTLSSRADKALSKSVIATWLSAWYNGVEMGWKKGPPTLFPSALWRDHQGDLLVQGSAWGSLKILTQKNIWVSNLVQSFGHHGEEP